MTNWSVKIDEEISDLVLFEATALTQKGTILRISAKVLRTSENYKAINSVIREDGQPDIAV